MTTPDLRADVRARMAVLGITQAALAARLAPRWGCSVDSAVRRLSRWQTRAADITSDPLADVLAELGGTLTWDTSESSSDETVGAFSEPSGHAGLTCREPT